MSVNLPNRPFPANQIVFSYTQCAAVFEVLNDLKFGKPNLDDALDGKKVGGRNAAYIIAALKANPRPHTREVLYFIQAIHSEAKETRDHTSTFMVIGLAD